MGSKFREAVKCSIREQRIRELQGLIYYTCVCCGHLGKVAGVVGGVKVRESEQRGAGMDWE